MTQYKSVSKLLANRSGALVALISAVVLWAASSSVAAQGQTHQAQANPQTLVIKEFEARVKGYMALQKKMESAVPALSPTSKPEKIEVGKNTLAIAMQGARREAKPGDIFGSAAPLIREWIRQDAKNRTTRQVYAVMEEVPKQNPPAVNAEYPKTADVATVPPLLLMKLPPLPEGLEYRFMGRALILYDAKANLIADFMHDAVPSLLKKKADPNILRKK